MAVGVQAFQSSKTGGGNLARPIVTTANTSESMTSIMSYQYPAPDVDVSPSNLINNYHPAAVLPPSSHSQPQHKASPIRRGAPGTAKTSKVKRSSSTPNVRGQGKPDLTDATIMALVEERRRNKLGYHRTSVACGHCRRRKIRCIPAPGDPQNRCSNCIRLKKECQYHPVDQQAEPGLARRDSQVQGGNAQASSSSSPTNGAGQASELHNTLPYPPNLSIPPIHDIGSSQTKRSRADSFLTDNKPPVGSRPSEYGPSPTGWMPNDSVSMVKASSDVPSSYWRINGHEPPLTTFSPFTPSAQPPQHSNWPHSATEPNPREDISWSVPQRSMSYSSHDSLHHASTYSAFHQNSSESNIKDEFPPRQVAPAPDAYAPTLTPTSVSGSTAESNLSSTTTDAAQHTSIPPPLPPPFPISQAWQGYSYKVHAPLPNHEGFGGWYSQASTLPSHSHSGEGMQSPAYGQVDSYSEMYYPSATQGGR